MIRKLRRLFVPGRRLPGKKTFNRNLLEQQRDDVYVLLHQQLGGLR